jgi:hypothetical protein
MIPYDDLVAALQNWRAKQGLPVSTLGAAPQPMAKSPSGPKSAPPPPRAKGGSIPPPLQNVDTVEEVEEHEIDESSYENEGDDFAMGFASKDSSTEIGSPPSRDSVQTDPVGAYPPSRGGKPGKPEDEW